MSMKITTTNAAAATHFFLLAHYVPNIAKRSIWNQCDIEDRPTDDRPLFLKEPSWKNFETAISP